MIQTVTMFQTDDGQVFKSHILAEEHEKQIKHKRNIQNLWVKEAVKQLSQEQKACKQEIKRLSSLPTRWTEKIIAIIGVKQRELLYRKVRINQLLNHPKTKSIISM
jgi:hypothetical protein